jgi:hypothetical protein
MGNLRSTRVIHPWITYIALCGIVVSPARVQFIHLQGCFCAARSNTTRFGHFCHGAASACILLNLFILNIGRYAFLTVAFLPPTGVT